MVLMVAGARGQTSLRVRRLVEQVLPLGGATVQTRPLQGGDCHVLGQLMKPELVKTPIALVIVTI